MIALPIFAVLAFIVAFFGASDRFPLLGQTAWISFAIYFSATCIVESIRRNGDALLRVAERMERNQVLADVAAQKSAVPPKPPAPPVSDPSPTAIEPSFDFLTNSAPGRSGQRARRS